jgi:hypothetical protein
VEFRRRCHDRALALELEMEKNLSDGEECTVNQISHPAVVAISAVVADAANILKMPVEAIVVEYVEAREWRDSCLELPKNGEACLDVVTPGYHVALGAGFRYRTDQQGNIRREVVAVETELRVYFKQTGGIGGWTSEYSADDSTLPPADVKHLRQFIEDTNFFHLPPEVGNGAPIADGFTYRLFLAVGRRNHTVETYDGSGPAESPALLELIDWLKQRAPQPGPRVGA